jgi:Uma2 family endonuclease
MLQIDASIPVLTEPADKPLVLQMSEDAFEVFSRGEFASKAEWANGEVMVPMAASIKHVDIQAFLLALLYFFCKPRKLGKVFGENAQLRFSTLKTRRTPDVAFLSAERLNLERETYIEGAPDLVIEIVSPDSVSRDWRDKYLEYEAAGVREYWVVDPQSEQVEACMLSETGEYSKIPVIESQIRSRVLAGFFLQPEWLWLDDLPNPLEILAKFTPSESTAY